MIENNLKKHFKENGNFSRNELFQFYQLSEPELNKNTFAWRIYNLKKKRVILETARGKYSFIDKNVYSLQLSKYSKKISVKISKSFSEIDFCVSESNWINDFTSHQYSNNFTIVEIEKDFMESVFFKLKNVVKMTLKKEQIESIKAAASKFLYYRRPPEEIRDQVDLAYRIEEQSVLIYEIRPKWNDETIIIEEQIAKATYVQAQKHWKIFWMRGNLKWIIYEPIPYVKLISDYFDIVAEDEMNCFFG